MTSFPNEFNVYNFLSDRSDSRIGSATTSDPNVLNTSSVL